MDHFVKNINALHVELVIITIIQLACLLIMGAIVAWHVRKGVKRNG